MKSYKYDNGVHYTEKSIILIVSVASCKKFEKNDKYFLNNSFEIVGIFEKKNVLSKLIK